MININNKDTISCLSALIGLRLDVDVHYFPCIPSVCLSSRRHKIVPAASAVWLQHTHKCFLNSTFGFYLKYLLCARVKIKFAISFSFRFLLCLLKTELGKHQIQFAIHFCIHVDTNDERGFQHLLHAYDATKPFGSVRKMEKLTIKWHLIINCVCLFTRYWSCGEFRPFRMYSKVRQYSADKLPKQRKITKMLNDFGLKIAN